MDQFILMLPFLDDHFHFGITIIINLHVRVLKKSIVTRNRT